MLTTPPPPQSQMDPALADLTRLRQFTGPPNEFWPAFIAASAKLIRACRGLVILRDSKQPERLKKLTDWTAAGHVDSSTVAFNRLLPELTEECAGRGECRRAIAGPPNSGVKAYALAVTLPVQGTTEKCVAAFLVLDRTEAQADEALVRLHLAADLPLSYQVNQAAAQAKNDVEKFASVLDVMVQVNAEKRFLAAALALCNGLASRFECERVSLGWLEKGYIRLRAMSRTERFDKHMTAVRELEAAMEESLDQNEEVLWPRVEELSQVTKDHELFARRQEAGNVCSVPLRLEAEGVAVLTCERGAKPFTQPELEQFRLACDHAVRRLADLKRRDRWFGARWAGAARDLLAKALGPEHTWAKVLVLTGCTALVLLLLPIYNYRVEGDFILRSEEVSFLTAPFDGYINSVEIRPGDVLQAGGTLLGLNTDDLLLEESLAVAEQVRYLREAERARASAALAEMRIAEALADQAKARLDLIRYRLDRAAVRAPFEGVVVEGDLRQRIGAPVRQGEALYKLARTDSLYVEVEVNQRYIHDILDKVTGEIAFVSQPKLKFPIRIVQIEPAAFPKDGENIFLVRCEIEGPPEPWWRPGMSGVCKLNVEDRTLLWILTHRTVDFLRLLFWW